MTCLEGLQPVQQHIQVEGADVVAHVGVRVQGRQPVHLCKTCLNHGDDSVGMTVSGVHDFTYVERAFLVAFSRHDLHNLMLWPTDESTSSGAS